MIPFDVTSIAAKSMLVPTKVTEADLQKTATGQKALEFVKEGIQNGHLNGKHVEKFLKKISKANEGGTCFGQASAVMIADKGATAGKEKEVIFRTSEIDAVAFQLMSDIEEAVKASVKLGKLCAPKLKPIVKCQEKVDAKIKKIEKHTVNKNQKKKLKHLKKEKSELKKGLEKTLKAFDKDLSQLPLPGIQVIMPEKMKEMIAFSDKVKETTRSLVEQHGSFQFIGREKFSKDDKDKFLKRIKELVSNDSQMALRLIMSFKNSPGHAVALFTNPRPSIYDSNIGMTKPKNVKGFLQVVEKLYCKNNLFYGKTEKLSLEIFKRK